MSLLAAENAMIAHGVDVRSLTVVCETTGTALRQISVVIRYGGPVVTRYRRALGPLLLAAQREVGDTAISFVAAAARYVLMSVIAIITSTPDLGTTTGDPFDPQPHIGSSAGRGGGTNLAADLAAMRQQIGELTGVEDAPVRTAPGHRGVVVRTDSGNALVRAWDEFVAAVIGRRVAGALQGPRVEGL